MNDDNLNNDNLVDVKPVLSVIKVGRKEYEIKKGDYVLYNGSCYQFCSGDGRTLKFENWTTYSNLRIPNVMVKKIPFDRMEKQNYKSSGIDLVRWFF